MSSPVKPEPEEEHKVVKKGGGGKDKYDRMSEKNLQVRPALSLSSHVTRQRAYPLDLSRSSWR